MAKGSFIMSEQISCIGVVQINIKAVWKKELNPAQRVHFSRLLPYNRKPVLSACLIHLLRGKIVRILLHLWQQLFLYNAGRYIPVRTEDYSTEISCEEYSIMAFCTHYNLHVEHFILAISNMQFVLRNIYQYHSA